MDSSVLVTIFHQLYDPGIPPSKLAQLNDGLRLLETEENCGKICLQILNESHVDYVHIAAISILERYIKRKCLLSPNPELIKEINLYLWPIVVTCNSVVGSKMANLIVYIAKYDLLSCPIHLIRKILEILFSFKIVLVGSQMLLSVSEQFVNPRGVLRKRSVELEEGLKSLISEMFTTVFNVLDVLLCLNNAQKIANCGIFADFSEVTDDNLCNSVARNLLKFVENLIPLSKTESLDMHFISTLFNYSEIGDSFKVGFSRGYELSGISTGIIYSIIRDKLSVI